MESALLTPFVRSWLLCTFKTNREYIPPDFRSLSLSASSKWLLHPHCTLCPSAAVPLSHFSTAMPLVVRNSGPRRSQDHETRRWHHLRRRLRLYRGRPLFEHHRMFFGGQQVRHDLLRGAVERQCLGSRGRRRGRGYPPLERRHPDGRLRPPRHRDGRRRGVELLLLLPGGGGCCHEHARRRRLGEQGGHGHDGAECVVCCVGHYAHCRTAVLLLLLLRRRRRRCPVGA